MTCYIYRDKSRQLIGPFRSADQAMEHREEIRELHTRKRGRPRHAGIILSVEEAIKASMNFDVKRLTPEQDYYATDKDEQETHTERVA